MANSKISALPIATALQGDESFALFKVVQLKELR